MKNTKKIALAAACAVPMLPATSGAMITLFTDDFSAGSALGVGGESLVDGWVSSGPEEKAYNAVNTATADFTGVLGWNGTGLGSFDYAATSFSGVTLAAVGDNVTMTMDYAMQGALNASTGLRVRLFDQAVDPILLVDTPFAHEGAYGVNVSVGGNTAGVGYITRTSGGTFGGGGNDASAAAGAFYGDTGTLILTVTRTGATEITLGGSLVGSEGSVTFNDVVQATSYYTFDALGAGVASFEHGVAIDNVVVTTNVIPEPSMMGLVGIAGLMGFAFRRRPMR